MIEFTVKYLAKYRLKNNQHYIFSTCGLCFNQKSGKLVKQITKKYTIGYLIDGRFKSMVEVETRERKFRERYERFSAKKYYRRMA